MMEYKQEKLGDVCDFIGGSQPPKSNFIYDLSEVDKNKYVRLIQIRDYKSDNHIVYILKSSTKKFCAKDDVMIGRYGPPVFQILRGLGGAYNVALMKAVPKTAGLDKEYLFHFLASPEIQNYILKLSERAAGQTGVNKKALYDYPIPAPALNEQKHIVAILDQAFANIEKIRAKTEQNLKNASEFFNSYLQKVFSQCGKNWKETVLIDITENLDNKRAPITKKDRIKGKYPYYGASGIVDYVNEYIFDENLLLVSEDGANLLARTYPIAFSASGKYWVNNHAHILRFKDKSVQKFIEYYLNLISLAPYVTGMAQPKLNQKALNSIPVPKVPSEVTKTILKTLNSLSNEVFSLKNTYSIKLEMLNELKKSILQKAFTGELTASFK